MIDSHAHIINEFYDDIDILIKKIKKEKIIAVINCSDSLETAKEVLHYSKIYNNYLFPTIGIHPQNVEYENTNFISEFEELVSNNKYVAIGEIGLDYSGEGYDKEKQRNFFIKQIEIAEKYRLPIIVHSRDSIQETYDILKQHKGTGVIHCYSGSVEMAKKFVELGYYLGIGGVVTFKNARLCDVVDAVSIDHLLLETDSPFLSPEPLRGRKNDPSNIKHIAKKISEIKNITVKEVIEKTKSNTINIFDLKV